MDWGREQTGGGNGLGKGLGEGRDWGKARDWGREWTGEGVILPPPVSPPTPYPKGRGVRGLLVEKV